MAEEKSIYTYSKYDTGDSLSTIFLSEYFPKLPRDIEYMSSGSKMALVRGTLYRFTVVDQKYEETSWSDIPWDEMQGHLDDAQSGRKSPGRSITYIKVEKVPLEEYGNQLYEMLKADEYTREPYHTKDLNEGMALIMELKSIREVLCPHYLVNHNAKCAYTIVDKDDESVFIKRDDIDWISLKSIETDREVIRNYEKDEEGTETSLYTLFKETAYGALDVAFLHDEPFCDTSSIEIGEFKNGVALISWQYYYGNILRQRMIRLYGLINDKAQIVAKFRVVDKLKEPDAIRKRIEG